MSRDVKTHKSDETKLLYIQNKNKDFNYKQRF